MYIDQIKNKVEYGLTTKSSKSSISYSFENFSYSENRSGFYVGALADFTLSESFHLPPRYFG